MDVSVIVQGIFKEFELNRGSHSVLFENHLYGLLVLYQSISGDYADIDISSCWSSIGIENGFYNHDQAFYEGSSDYKNMWIRVFQDASCSTAEFSDALQDALFSGLCLKGAVFFAAALNTGELPASLENYADSLFTEESKKQEQEEEQEQKDIHKILDTIFAHNERAPEHTIVNVEPEQKATEPEQKTTVEPTPYIPATIRYRYTRGRVRSPIIGQKRFSRTRKAKQIVI